MILDLFLTTQRERKIFFDNIDIPKNVEIVGIWVENTWENIIKNNSEKQGFLHLDQAELKDMFDKRFPPKSDEPFDDIYFLTLNVNLGISLSHPILTSVQQILDRI